MAKPAPRRPWSSYAARLGIFEVLLVKRNDKVAFMAGAYVFPGGRVDEEDKASRHAEPATRRRSSRPAFRI